MGQGFTGDMESSHDIGVDNPVEGFVNHVIRLQNRCRTLKPSIVDQNVDMAELLHDSTNAHTVCYVADMSIDGRAGLLNQCFGGGYHSVVRGKDMEVGSCLRETSGDAKADAS